MCFTNGAIVRENGDVYIYYASSDTRVHVASTTIDKLMDYTFNTPSDPLRSVDCVKQRYELIEKNLKILGEWEKQRDFEILRKEKDAFWKKLSKNFQPLRD